jgi:aldehyde dehydrogenase (NAD+)
MFPQRVMRYIQSGRDEGATLVTGGSRIGSKGYYIQPTIFTNAKNDMKIVKEEIFGPVGVVVKFETEEEVLKLANDTHYGLSTCVFTQNISRAIRFSNQAESGMVFVRWNGII